MPKPTDEILHRSVLLDETIELLAPQRGGVYIDATLGLGGHTFELLRRFSAARVIGLDQDADALTAAKERLLEFGDRFTGFHANFAAVAEVAEKAGVRKVDGILADLGVSSMQFDSETRGFSFRFDAPLDMRMDPSSGSPTAADLLADLSEEEIANIIYRFGEERHSRRIARRIVERRQQGDPVTTTKDLAELVARSVRRGRHDKIHPATRTFQALRIAVNQEMDMPERFIPEAVGRLDSGGRLAIITFHSLEDRIVKRVFQRLSGKCVCPPRMPRCECGAVKLVEVLTKKPIVPSQDEIDQNPRARSAKLRGVKKLEQAEAK